MRILHNKDDLLENGLKDEHTVMSRAKAET